VGSVALDANVVVGLLDAGDVHHARAVEAFRGLRREDRRLLPASVYAESVVRPLRNGNADRFDEALDGLGIEVVAIGRAIARRAAALRASHDSLKLPDALFVAVALELGAATLTFDEPLQRIIERL